MDDALNNFITRVTSPAPRPLTHLGALAEVAMDEGLHLPLEPYDVLGYAPYKVPVHYSPGGNLNPNEFKDDAIPF